MDIESARPSSNAATPAALAAELAAYRETLAPYPQNRFEGDGIVICAGGAAIFTNAYVLVFVLRTVFQCRLPIEVWHLGAGEMSARMKVLLRDLSAKTVDADAVTAAMGMVIKDGWQLKSFALSYASFSRVLLLDADIVPERDPAALFEWPQFEATGAVLWPDICSIVAENPIWPACGLAPRTTRAVESGQVLIDKSRHWDALQIIVFLNLQRDHYYRMVYGDKDLFLIGFLLTGRPYDLVPHVPFSDQPWCLFQRDFDGERLFQHRTNAKWRYQGPQIPLPSFRYLDACEHALETLRRDWNGYVFDAPARDPAALEEEERLLAIRTLRRTAPGEFPVTFDLVEGNEIIAGGSSDLVHWYCTGYQPVELILCDKFERSIRFRPERDRRWVQTDPADVLASVLVETGQRDTRGRSAAPDKRFEWENSRYRFHADV